MIVMDCIEISKSFGINTILDSISLKVEHNDKIGIVGVNGAGKSTFMNILCKRLEQDSGRINILKDKKIVYLEQNPVFESQETLFDEMMKEYAHLIKMEKELELIESKMKVETNEIELEKLVNLYTNMSEEFKDIGGYEKDSRAKGILKGLGFRVEDFSLNVMALSGGQKTRLAIAKLLVGNADILLIDEPTNHLDLSAILWLEDFLKNYDKAVVLISHDRYFLDKVCNKIFDIEHTEGKLYLGNYSEFCNKKEFEKEIEQRHYDNQQKEISRMESIVEQQRQFNRERNIIAAESRLKALDRMEKLDKPKRNPPKVNIQLQISRVSGTDVLNVVELSKSFPSKSLFNNISFEVKRGDKVFILGPNGCGKTTMLKILASLVKEYEGKFSYGQNVNIAYYSQELENLRLDNTIFEEIDSCTVKISETEIRNLLAAFLFKGDDVYKQIKNLSGGEKSRVALVKIMLSGANMLLLDEPTNHLDINSKNVLEEALSKYEGTMLVVSHDRYFINKLATRFLEFDGDKVINYIGNYNEYIEYKNRNLTNYDNESSEFDIKRESKLKYEEEKKIKANQKKLEKELSSVENRIMEVEQLITEIEEKMHLDEVICDHQRLADYFDEKQKYAKELESLYERWENF